MYVRQVEDKALNFQVSGKLWQRSLVMRDRETETLWSHLLGEAMEGPLEGTKLEVIPSVMTTWADWKERYPETSILAMSRTAGGYDESQWDRPRRFVFGIVGEKNGDSPAVSLRKLQKEGVVIVETRSSEYVFTHLAKGGSVQVFRTTLEGTSYTFQSSDNVTMTDRDTNSIWSRETGEAISGTSKGKQLEQIAGTLSFTQAWETFYPDSEIFE